MEARGSRTLRAGEPAQGRELCGRPHPRQVAIDPRQAAGDPARSRPAAAAEVVEKVLHSAVANAEQQPPHEGRRRCSSSEAYVDEGPTLKRIQPRAMGRAFRINKRTSHITVVVKQREEA